MSTSVHTLITLLSLIAKLCIYMIHVAINLQSSCVAFIVGTGQESRLKDTLNCVV